MFTKRASAVPGAPMLSFGLRRMLSSASWRRDWQCFAYCYNANTAGKIFNATYKMEANTFDLGAGILLITDTPSVFTDDR
jgi:hypothetical protein